MPAETYFNYSKRYEENATASDLQSPFISNDCGLSSNDYNTQNQSVSQNLKSIFDTLLNFAFIAAFLFLVRFMFNSQIKFRSSK